MDQDQPSCSSTGPKPKRLKKKTKSEQHSPTTSSNSNSSPINRSPGEKECQYYAGVGPDSTQLYAKEVNCEDISDDACNLLTEDINYKLRYILHDCLIKGKLQGRENILSSDIEEAFSDLTIDKVYGAPSSPNWQRDGRDNRLYYLEDQKINFVEIAEKEFRYSQEGEFLTDPEWVHQDNDSETDTEEYRELFAEYFQTMCEAVVSESAEIRHMALLDISTNPNIGRITDWFYHFSYFLLTKNLTYDHLTMRALHLLETLENSPLSSMHVYGKQLRLLIRLLLQRLLISTANEDVIKYMCYVLSLFCLRPPLMRMVLRKLQDKIVTVDENMTMAFLNIIYYVGIDAIKTVFLPNLFHFLNMEKYNPDLTDVIMAIYGAICKADLNKNITYFAFRESFGYILLPYYRPKLLNQEVEKREMSVVSARVRLMQTRRKLQCSNSITENKDEEVFQYASHNCAVERHNVRFQGSSTERPFSHRENSFKLLAPCCALRKKIEICNQQYQSGEIRRDTKVTVGQISALLPIRKFDPPKFCKDHSLLNCWL